MRCADGQREAGSRKREAGFTLYEVVIVLVVLLVVSSVVIPSFSGLLPSVKVRRSGDGLMSTIAKARDDAVLTSRRIRIVFSKDPAAYRLEYEPDPMNEPATFRPLPGDWGDKTELPDGVSIVVDGAEPNEETSEEHLEFSPDGTASEAQILLSHENGDMVRLEVNPADGRVRVVEDEEESP